MPGVQWLMRGPYFISGYTKKKKKRKEKGSKNEKTNKRKRRGEMKKAPECRVLK